MSPKRNGYKNFKVAIWLEVDDMKKMADKDWLEKTFDTLQKHIKIDKVYLETYRSMVITDRSLLQRGKDFFESKGIKVSGGFMAVRGMGHRPSSFCFTNPEHRELLRKVVALSAEMFDEILLDDMYNTHCRCESCTKAKGNRSWTEFRLELMKEVSENIVLKTARSVNPKVNMIIKYPNWYDDYQSLGYNLKDQPRMFDMIYAGTETRDAEYTIQHLQEYQSYALVRYFENVKPGKNGGGWVDPGSRRTLDRYAEQFELTLFAKPREVTLWPYGPMVDFIKQPDGSSKPISVLAPVVGYTFEQADSFLGKLGQPYGITSYKPYHSSGENYLHNYIGMLGIPMDIVPEFPTKSNTLFLTESAKYDEKIVEKIQDHVFKGKTVIITSGLLNALQGKGIENLFELKCTDKKVVANTFTTHGGMDGRFAGVYHSDTDILLPQIQYACEDMIEIITALAKGNGYPLLMEAWGYEKGHLYVLTIPDNFGDLYHLPQEILTKLRQVMMADFPVYLDSRSRVCLFTYDNDTFIVEPFLPHPVKCNIVVKKKAAKLNDLMSGEEISGVADGNETVFKILLQPGSRNISGFVGQTGSYRVFKFN